MLKKSIILILFTIASSAYAQKCHYSWELSSLGMNIGSAEDDIYLEAKKVSIKSTFIPSDFLKTFNVKNINRNINYDNQLNFLDKQEYHFKNKKEFKMESNRDNISADGKTFEKKHNLTIDSTSFPYIYNLYTQNGQELPKNVNILTKNKVMYGEIYKEIDRFSTTGENWSILVNFEPINKTPTKILIKTDSQNVTATLKEKRCQNQ